MESKKHKHFLSLPKFLSKSGQKPGAVARWLFVVVGLVLVLVGFNALVASATEGVIYPGVSVAGTDLSFKTRAQALQLLKQKSGNRTVTLKIGNTVVNANNTEFGASYDPVATVDLAYSIGRTNPVALVGLNDSLHRGELGMAYSFDQIKLKKFAAQVVGNNGRDPVNATISIVDGVASVVPDQPGLAIDQAKLAAVLTQSMSDGEDTIASIEPGLAPAPIQVPQAEAALPQVNNLLNHSVVLTYQGKSFSPSKADMGHWLEFQPVIDANKNYLKVGVSHAQILGYMQSVANQVDVAPTNRKVTVLNGAETEMQVGKDGSAINQQSAADAIFAAISSNQNVTVALTSSPVAYKTETKRINGGGQPYAKYVEVNLSNQTLYAWQDGQVVFSSPVTSGKDYAPTITGTFAIYTKTRNRYLNGAQYGYNYNVFVSYWMPFVGGYGLHDASWRTYFGGQDYHYNGSHGCVNMPTGAAAFLWGWTEVGTPVWVHY